MTGVDAGLAQRVRGEVTQGLVATIGQTTRGSGARVEAGRRLVADSLERYANECLSDGKPVLDLRSRTQFQRRS